MDKIDKLKKLLELSQNDTITPAEVQKFLEFVLQFITKSKTELQAISEENLKIVRDSIAFLEEFHKKQVNTLDSKINASLEQFKVNTSVLKGLINDVQTINATPGRDGIDGVDGVDGKDGSPDTRKEIVKKINKGKKNDTKIGIEQIDGTDRLKKGIEDL